MNSEKQIEISDTGERILPAQEGEISFVFSRHKFAYEYVQRFVENKTVIDVGCGTGYGCKILAEKAQLVYGIDNNEEAIIYCKGHYPSLNIKYIQMDANTLDLEKQFDIAVTFQVIEHLADVEHFVDGLKQIVKPNGMIFISTPNTKKPDRIKNPFHVNQMNYTRFQQIISDKFSTFEILGVAYATPNRLRNVIGKLPFYKWGKILKRNSKLKKMANRALDLSTFRIIHSNLENEAADFLAVCQNN